MDSFPTIRSIRRSGLILAVGFTLTLPLLAGCGSDDANNGGSSPVDSGKQPVTTDAEGEVKPGAKEPESAGDRKPGAPDGAISERPGGPGSSQSDP